MNKWKNTDLVFAFAQNWCIIVVWWAKLFRRHEKGSKGKRFRWELRHMSVTSQSAFLGSLTHSSLTFRTVGRDPWCGKPPHDVPGLTTEVPCQRVHLHTQRLTFQWRHAIWRRHVGNSRPMRALRVSSGTDGLLGNWCSVRTRSHLRGCVRFQCDCHAASQFTDELNSTHTTCHDLNQRVVCFGFWAEFSCGTCGELFSSSS